MDLLPSSSLRALRVLVGDLIERKVGVGKCPYGQLIKEGVSACMTCYVGVEPQRLGDWKREKKWCGCGECPKADELLDNSEKEEETRFPAWPGSRNERRRTGRRRRGVCYRRCLRSEGGDERVG